MHRMRYAKAIPCAIAFLLTVSLTASSSTELQWQTAKWITSPTVYDVFDDAKRSIKMGIFIRSQHPIRKLKWREIQRTFYQHQFPIANKPIRKAILRITAQSQGAQIYLNGTYLGAIYKMQTFRDLRIEEQLVDSSNLLAIKTSDPKKMSNLGICFGIEITYADGSVQNEHSGDHTSVYAEFDVKTQPLKRENYDDLWWTKPPTNTTKWNSATEGGKNTFSKNSVLPMNFKAPLLRKSFALNKTIEKATLHISGVGLYEAWINGEALHKNSVLNPAQTNYDQYAFYDSVDVSSRLKKGNNAVAVIVGNGFYHQPSKYGGFSYGMPGMVAIMDIEYSDGSHSQLVSNESWKATDSFITANCMYTGEDADSNLEIKGWSTAKLEEKGWQNAKVIQPCTAKLIESPIPPIRQIDTMTPLTVKEAATNVWVYDMGRNFSGWCYLETDLPTKTTLQLRYAETLAPDGRVSPDSTSGVAECWPLPTNRWTFSGNGVEAFEPRFSYYGFRYVELTGYPGKPPVNLLKGIVIRSDLSEVGDFECSSDLLNSIYLATRRTIESNLHGIPTDCPTREKCGWLGDAWLISELLSYTFDAKGFLTKYVGDIESSLGTGRYIRSTSKPPKKPGLPTNVAPGLREMGQARVDWGHGLVELPYHLYAWYRDRDTLEQMYPHIKRWVKYVEQHETDNYIVKDGYGDWGGPSVEFENGRCPTEITSTAIFYRSVRIAEKTASLLGRPQDTKQFNEMAGQIQQAFNRSFFDPQNKSYGWQTANVLALSFGLVPDDKRHQVEESLVSSIESAGYRTACGIIGIRFLYDALANIDRPDLIGNLLLQTDYPSLGNMINQGATTIWEGHHRKGERTFGTKNHYMQASFMATVQKKLLGIEMSNDAPGFDKLDMKPIFIPQLNWAKGSYRTPHGYVQSSWERKNGIITWKVEIPEGITATINLPKETPRKIKKGIYKFDINSKSYE